MNVTSGPSEVTHNQEFSAFEPILIDKLKRLGGEVLALRESGDLRTKTKSSPSDLVTLADTTVENELEQILQTHRRNDGLRGEEGTKTSTKSGLTWYIDPIDGTLNYARGDDNFGLSIGCANEDDPKYAALLFPATNRLFTATAGGGATFNSAPLKTPQVSREIKELIGELYLDKTKPETVAAFCHLRSRVGGILISNCASHAIVQVAQGKLDFAIHGKPTVYDYGAAALIAKESGCYVARDLKSNPILFANGPTPIVVARSIEVVNILKNEFEQFGVLV